MGVTAKHRHNKKKCITSQMSTFAFVMEERKDRDAYLVTGNIKHFPIKPFIVTPRQMLDIIVHRAEE